MDVALLGAPDADRPAGADLGHARHRGVLRLGLPGRACCATPNSSPRCERANVGVLFVHAVNPHGFSHGRRVNEDNADLNRNFRDFTQPAPVNAAYAEVHPLLLPATWPPPADNEQRIAAYVAAHGERAYQAAVSGGQYAFPDGLFYGGARAAWSNRTLHAVLRRHASARRRLGWIDFHTGLGPRGHGEKIYAGRDLPADLARTRAWWGGDVTSFHDGSSTSAPVTGIVTERRLRRVPRRRIRRHRARVRHAAARARSSPRCAPTTGCTTIPRRPRRSGRRSGSRCAPRSTATPTTGS